MSDLLLDLTACDGDLAVQLLDAGLEQGDHLVRGQHGHDRQSGDEAVVFGLRCGDQFTGPVLGLGATGFGELVDDALGPGAVALAADDLDEAVLLQVLHHRVERAPLDVHVALFAAFTQYRRDLVTVHRALEQRRQYREGQQISDFALCGHSCTSLLAYEYTSTSIRAQALLALQKKRTTPGLRRAGAGCGGGSATSAADGMCGSELMRLLRSQRAGRDVGAALGCGRDEESSTTCVRRQ